MSSQNKINFNWKKFDQLSNEDLYAVASLRQKVFVVEQNCPYLDLDYSDQEAMHLLGFKDNSLVVYLRAFPPDIKYKGSSLGRIVVDESERNNGHGELITKMGIDYLQKNFPESEIVISAQHRLMEFYQALGFIPRGSVYLEDDIDHIQMYLNPA